LAYTSDVHAVVETASFIAAAKAAGLSEGDLERIIDHLARRPDAGDLIQARLAPERFGSPGAARARVAVIA
jgi:hypothetical protein